MASWQNQEIVLLPVSLMKHTWLNDKCCRRLARSIVLLVILQKLFSVSILHSITHTHTHTHTLGSSQWLILLDQYEQHHLSPMLHPTVIAPCSWRSYRYCPMLLWCPPPNSGCLPLGRSRPRMGPLTGGPSCCTRLSLSSWTSWVNLSTSGRAEGSTICLWKSCRTHTHFYTHMH